VPPRWMRTGVLVDYHSVIGSSVTRSGLRVVSDPRRDRAGQWVVKLDGIPGVVAVEAVTKHDRRSHGHR